MAEPARDMSTANIVRQTARVEYRLDVRDVRADTGKKGDLRRSHGGLQDVGTTAAIDAGGAVERYPTESEEVEGVIAAAAGGSHMAGTTEIHTQIASRRAAVKRVQVGNGQRIPED